MTFITIRYYLYSDFLRESDLTYILSKETNMKERNNKKMLGTAIKFLLPFAFLTYGHPAMAQAIVKGRVIDDGGEPIMGAHIQWKDTKVAATSDIDGYFSIPYNNKGKLVVSFLGYKTK